MQKIPTLFQRNYETDRLVRNEVTPGTEWVFTPDACPTRKHDGTCCLIHDGQLWKRYELKQGRMPPPGFILAQEPDDTTGDTPGWLPVGETPDDRWHREAFAVGHDEQGAPLTDGTYELIGPKVQGNPELAPRHILVRHGSVLCWTFPAVVTFATLRAYLVAVDIEGIVWHHPDGRLCKLKKRDFGLRRPKDGASRGN